VTPRKPTSKWSSSNRRRWAELEAAGLLAPAGRAAAPTSNTYAPKPTIPDMPGYIVKALKANAKAWAFFQSLADAPAPLRGLIIPPSDRNARGRIRESIAARRWKKARRSRRDRFSTGEANDAHQWKGCAIQVRTPWINQTQRTCLLDL
jgi:hypothetical protein